ncbi:Ger(x)C family spore germination protein [Aneurinibacillus thermoaerophilus]|jgi:spore germination protein KC|uniref:Ger(x)C family spore germination protein n=1 Tax=Aneurinibacillus thermoaerophilus TaxID=143495 RepID=UPI002E205865|nr:Ger(x)C family spore germination protein [Aneurinibacillus thermoaerophilus]MED0763838.1 Ger(x)C family spore germination protein [Aneurinibacillus thermoaerophilus]
MAYRYAAGLFILMMFTALLAACWDKTEMNELALVSMVGVDIDPESGKKTVYYQIINPLSGTSARGTPGGEQAPVYTYEISGSSFGEIKSTIYKMLPRKLFIAHSKVLLVSRRAARQGVRDIVNFIEMQPNGRSSVPMLIVDGPISQVMKTFTPLERVPSDAIDSRLKLLIRNSLLTGKHIKVNDVIERMEKSDTIVLPMIAGTTEKPSSNSGETAADIDANQNNFIIGGGAVFRDYRMVGKLNDAQLVWYHLLNGDRGRHVRRFQVEGKQVSVELRLVRMKRDVYRQSDQPVVRIRLDLELSTTWANEFVPRSRAEVERLESNLNRIIEDESLAFYQMTRERGWDLLRIRDLLRKQTPNHPDIDQAAKNAKVTIEVATRLLRTGSMNQPYEGTG